MQVGTCKYNIIYADPPWSYKDKALNRGGAERHYKTMDLHDICSIDVSSISADDSLLFMWAVWPKMFEAKEVIDSWGFTFKTCAFVWVKTNKRTNPGQLSFLPCESFDSFLGMGTWTRANTEFCLLATKGNPKRESAGVHQIIYAPIDKHSKKPAETRDRIIELAGDLPRIELFARSETPGWALWGNEIDSDLHIGVS